MKLVSILIKSPIDGLIDTPNTKGQKNPSSRVFKTHAQLLINKSRSGNT